MKYFGYVLWNRKNSGFGEYRGESRKWIAISCQFSLAFAAESSEPFQKATSFLRCIGNRGVLFFDG